MSRDKQTPSTYPEQLKWTSLYILKYGDCVPHKMVGLERMSDYTDTTACLHMNRLFCV